MNGDASECAPPHRNSRQTARCGTGGAGSRSSARTTPSPTRACTLVYTELFRFENAPLITLRAEQDECHAPGMFWASADARIRFRRGLSPALNLHRAVNVRRTASFQPAYFC